MGMEVKYLRDPQCPRHLAHTLLSDLPWISSGSIGLPYFGEQWNHRIEGLEGFCSPAFEFRLHLCHADVWIPSEFSETASSMGQWFRGPNMEDTPIWIVLDCHILALSP